MQHPKEYWRGVLDTAPISIAAGFFAVTYGTVAADKGLSFFEAMLLTTTVFAGASQFMALQFWSDPLPFVTIVLIVLAVNFRHILYGASLHGKFHSFANWQKAIAFYFLTDPNFALSEKRQDAAVNKPDDPGLTPEYYFGAASILFSVWTISSALGFLFGNLIENPRAIGIDFVLPLYFLIMLLGFRSRANWLPVVLVAGGMAAIAFATLGSPWHISIGAVTGVLAGAILGVPKQMGKV